MSGNNDEAPTTPQSWPFVLGRTVLFYCMLTGLAGVVYLALIGVDRKSNAEITITLSFLVILPACIGAIGAFLGDIRGEKRNTFGFYFSVPSFLLIGVVILSLLFLQEGMICVMLLSPLWWLSALGGAFTVRHFQRSFASRARLNCSILLIMPFAALAMEQTSPPPIADYVVTRSIEIDAPPSAIWEHLLRMDNITAAEGNWNITQDLLGVPRPTAAVISGQGPGAIRAASWEHAVSFEEHIIDWTPDTSMSWTFVFPNDSVREHTDEHISPDGHHLKIAVGGYTLTPLENGLTQLDLSTRFRVQTPVNTYASMWSELMLGDIQTNVLHIVRDRAEASLSVSVFRELRD